MARIHSVKLEILRPGPLHNQLLSPLTAYMCVCEDGSPVTFHVKGEHRALLDRLERLRYDIYEGRRLVAVPEVVRQATVGELGREMTALLTQIEPLRDALAHAQGGMDNAQARVDDASRLVHLRLVLGGSELALLPFELALAPQAMPGEGRELFLQQSLPLVATREMRLGRPSPAPWNPAREPRILLVAAAPEGLRVPLEAHVHALAAAVEPWVGWPPGKMHDPLARDPYYKQRLSVLPNASLDALRERCEREDFTHVHVLAHGTHVDTAGERRFGLAFHRHDDARRAEVVTGEQLAHALQARRATPTVVTLMTCDSAQVGSVLVPGGSTAHDLHVAGIPWVFASQFPLTVRGSVHLTADLYPRLLRGDDPRQALFDVRRRLYGAQGDHDWASLVAYASLPDDFDRQVAQFMGRQERAALNVSLALADHEDATEAERQTVLETVQRRLDDWMARLPDGDGPSARASRTECFGIHGASFKRLALLKQRSGAHADHDALLTKALDWYRKAAGQWDTEVLQQHHWVTTQVLSLEAVLHGPPDPANHAVALQLATRDLQDRDAGQRAWAHASLAELKLLAGYHTGTAASDASIVEHCRNVLELVGPLEFHVASTRRQFARYADPAVWGRAAWQSAAKAALEALGAGSGGGTLRRHADATE